MNIIKNSIFTIFLFFVIEISSSDIKKVTYAAWNKPDVNSIINYLMKLIMILN